MTYRRICLLLLAVATLALPTGASAAQSICTAEVRGTQVTPRITVGTTEVVGYSDFATTAYACVAFSDYSVVGSIIFEASGGSGWTALCPPRTHSPFPSVAGIAVVTHGGSCGYEPAFAGVPHRAVLRLSIDAFDETYLFYSAEWVPS